MSYVVGDYRTTLGNKQLYQTENYLLKTFIKAIVCVMKIYGMKINRTT